MDNSPVMSQDTQPMTPGIGVGGVVVCPLFKAPCFKSGCEFWVELMYGEQKVARCALSWLPIVTVELRQEIERLRKDLSRENGA